MGGSVDMIPTRARIPRRQAEAVGRIMAERVVSQWGIVNGKKIAGEMKKWFKTEAERRSKLKG
jgi:hypothetical protein